MGGARHTAVNNSSRENKIAELVTHSLVRRRLRRLRLRSCPRARRGVGRERPCDLPSATKISQGWAWTHSDEQHSALAGAGIYEGIVSVIANWKIPDRKPDRGHARRNIVKPITDRASESQSFERGVLRCAHMAGESNQRPSA
jgi:hypothetical protein